MVNGSLRVVRFNIPLTDSAQLRYTDSAPNRSRNRETAEPRTAAGALLRLGLANQKAR